LAAIIARLPTDRKLRAIELCYHGQGKSYRRSPRNLADAHLSQPMQPFFYFSVVTGPATGIELAKSPYRGRMARF